MHNLQQLTTTKENAQKLIELGIEPKGFIWHLREFDEVKGESWDVCLLNEPAYVPGQRIPAFTLAELSVMIGPDYPKPDLYTDDEVEKVKGAKDFDRNKYPVFMPRGLFETKNGADAAAVALIFFLENTHLDPKACNERYNTFFKPLTIQVKK